MQHYLNNVPTMENPMTPSIVKNGRVRTRISYMTADQLERFLRAAKEYGAREHAMFLFAVAHGTRAQEICNLRISDINFGNEQVHIARLKGSLASTQTLLKVKGNSLFDEKAALKAWLAVREPDADEHVFNSQKSTQLNRVTVFKLFREIAEARWPQRGSTAPARAQAHSRDAAGPTGSERLPDPAGCRP
jgi:integrase